MESLQTLSLQDTDEWKPKLEDSKETDKKKRVNGNKRFEVEFKANLQEFIKRISTFEENMFKAYVFYGKSVQKVCRIKLHQEKISKLEYTIIL